jgi:hypothetical protein
MEQEPISDALQFNNHFLNQIVFHAIQEDEFLIRVRSIVPLDIYRSRERITIMEMIYKYFDEYKCAPKDDFFTLFEEERKSMPRDLYNKCIALIGVLKDITGSNYKYIVQKLNDAILHFQLEEASVEFAALIKQKKYENAKGIILKALKPPDGIDKSYFDYFQDKNYILDRLKGNKYKMTTNIQGLDKLIGGINPPWIVTLLGATKAGKTWLLIELSLAAILQGLNVVFVSLEMNRKQIEERFDQVVGFMTDQHSDTPIEIRKKINNKWVVVKEKVKSIFDLEEVHKERTKLKRISGGGLKILAFDRGRMNYMDIDRTLDELENEGFIADIVIWDYYGLMKETQPNQGKKERIGENCLGMKEVCGKRNLIGVSAMQGNRKALTAKTFHSHMVADDIDTIFHSDLVIAICQTTEEENEGKYRLYIANYRHGNQHGTVGIVRDLNVGQMAIGEWDIKKEAPEKKKLKKEAGEDF